MDRQPSAENFERQKALRSECERVQAIQKTRGSSRGKMVWVDEDRVDEDAISYRGMKD